MLLELLLPGATAVAVGMLEHAVRKGVQMTLDANNVFVPYPRAGWLRRCYISGASSTSVKNAFEAIAKKKEGGGKAWCRRDNGKR